MTPDDVIAHYGSQAQAAVKLGFSPVQMSKWKAAGTVPKLRQWQIELATGGALKADVPPERAPANA